MPSVDQCATKSSDMTTLSNSLEVFDTSFIREDKDSDEESFHLPLDDDESDSKPFKNGTGTGDREQEVFSSISEELERRLLQDDVEIELNGNVERCQPEANVNGWKNDEKKLESDEEKSVKDTIANGDDSGDAIEKKISTQVEEAEDAQKEKCAQNELNETKSPANDDVKSDEKSDNSSDSSSKPQTEDSEDLFDISIIRDAEEDNAQRSIDNEENHAEESEGYDDRLDEKTDDGGKTNGLDEEEEEMDADKQEDALKNDDVDIEEANLKLDCDAGKEASDGGESDASNMTDLVQNSGQESSAVANSVNSSADVSDEQTSGKKNVPLQVGDETVEKTEDTATDSHKKKSGKRALPEEDDSKTTKKMRTEPAADASESKENQLPKEKLPLKTLLSFSDFMKNKKCNNKRLTMHDVEEFCLQKICEAIAHKSEMGDVHRQLKIQEQTIDAMKKEIQQLTKQTRDLEIVNKKLMNDLKQQSQKPLTPLKITRSVGLQVKFTAADVNKRRQQQPPQQVPITPQKLAPTVPQPRMNRNLPSSMNGGTLTTPRQVTAPPKTQPPKSNTTLLSQALQNRRHVTADSSPKTPSPAARAKQPEPKQHATPSSSVIDLTDEDDKKDKNKGITTKIVPLRNATVRVNSNPPSIRLSAAQNNKGPPITSVVTSSAPQLMYVVQSSPQNVLSPLTPKAVVVNFQSTNGVLTSTLNGSSVSMIPKQGIQLKPVGALTKPLTNFKAKSKHPAPLPHPPPPRMMNDKSLKPIPPKPVLSIRKTDTGIILQWKMPYELEMFEVIASYQLYAYQETSASPSTDMWRKVGDVKALALPMACTLTQFADKNKYYFAVRPVDIHKRIGMFSEPEEISL